MQAVTGRGPDPAAVVEPDTVKRARGAGGQHFTAGQGAVTVHREDPQLLAGAVGDVEPLLVRGERQPVGAIEVSGHPVS